MYAIRSYYAGFECVIHEAAQINVRTSVENPVFDANINVLGTINILEKMKEYDVKKIIFSSSGGAVYGEPEYLVITSYSIHYTKLYD